MLNRSTARRDLGPDDVAAIVFVITGLVGVLLLLGPERTFQRRDPEAFSALLVIATTVLLAGLIQFLTRVIRWLSERGERRAFHAFFGTSSSAIGIVPDLITRVDLDGWQPPASNGARPKGVTKVVPFEDLQAAIKIAELFDSFGVPFELRRDYENDEAPRETFVAIGLGFNRLTCMLADHSGLFQIRYKDTHTDELKDDFLVLGEPHPAPNEQRDYALIARVPFRHDGRDVTGFVCAGRMAAGTAAAGLYLKNEWRSLYAEYRKEGKSLDKDALAFGLEHTSGPMYAVRVCDRQFKAVEDTARSR